MTHATIVINLVAMVVNTKNKNAERQKEKYMKSITITKLSNASAIGRRTNGNCKPVLCITTGQIYVSAIDAAEKIGVSPASISSAITGKSKTVKGKRYCYVSNVMQYLDEISKNIYAREEKVAAYDKIVNAEKQKQALAQRRVKLNAMRQKLEEEERRLAEDERNLEV